MSGLAELLNGIAALLWVGIAAVALLLLRGIILARQGSLSKLGIGPTGVTMEFAEEKIDLAIKNAAPATQQLVGRAAKRSVVVRLQRNADLLAKARIMWVDDHPENNKPIIDLLQEFGATVDTPQSNAKALDLLKGTRYDVIISDVSRDNERASGELPGIELGREVYEQWKQRIVLFTARFDPATLPGADEHERLVLTRELGRWVFGRTNRMDEAVHLILDVLERG